MQVQAINNTNRNYNTSFGDMRGIVCDGKFSKYNPKHALAINEVLNSKAFKEFGKLYDYIAHFQLNSYLDCSAYYSLKLTPIEESPVKHSNNKSLSGFLKRLFGKKKNEVEAPIAEEKTPQIPNLPLEFLACNSYGDWDYESYNHFMTRLKTTDLDDLKGSLRFAIKESKKEQKEAQKLEKTYKEAYKNINDSEIPVY